MLEINRTGPQLNFKLDNRAQVSYLLELCVTLKQGLKVIKGASPNKTERKLADIWGLLADKLSKCLKSDGPELLIKIYRIEWRTLLTEMRLRASRLNEVRAGYLLRLSRPGNDPISAAQYSNSVSALNEKIKLTEKIINNLEEVRF